MDAALRTFQVTIPLTDASFLRHQSRKMGWNITTVRSSRLATPVAKMSEEDFRAKLEHSSAQAAEGHYVEKRKDETMAQFLNRVCM